MLGKLFRRRRPRPVSSVQEALLHERLPYLKWLRREDPAEYDRVMLARLGYHDPVATLVWQLRELRSAASPQPQAPGAPDNEAAEGLQLLAVAAGRYLGAWLAQALGTPPSDSPGAPPQG